MSVHHDLLRHQINMFITSCQPPRVCVSSSRGNLSDLANCPLLQVGLLLFGENFPPATDPPAEQVFSLVTASVGLASFALILALVEQASGKRDAL